MIGMKPYVHFFLTPMLLGIVDVLVVPIVVTFIALVIDVLVVIAVVCFVPLISVVQLNKMSPTSMIGRC